MYINYGNDRRKLGYKLKKDLESIEQLIQLKKNLSIPIYGVLNLGKKPILFVCSKETWLAISIFFGLINYSKSECYKPFINLSSDISRIQPTQSLEIVINLRAGGSKNGQIISKLAKSIIAKSCKTSSDQFQRVKRELELSPSNININDDLSHFIRELDIDIDKCKLLDSKLYITEKYLPESRNYFENFDSDNDSDGAAGAITEQWSYRKGKILVWHRGDGYSSSSSSSSKKKIPA